MRYPPVGEGIRRIVVVPSRSVRGGKLMDGDMEVRPLV